MSWDADERLWRRLPDSLEKEVELMFSSACVVALGDGATARFWTDNWPADGRSIANTAPALFTFVKDSGLSVREDLHNHRWIRDIRGGLSIQATAQYLQVWDMAHEAHLSPETSDRLL